MNKDEALKLALEAAEIGLAKLTSYQSAPRGPTIHEYGQAVLALIKVREAKAALAQPAQEPAEWSWVCNECGAHEFLSSVSESDLKFLSCGGCGCDEFHKENTAPPPRPWVGLTDEEMHECAGEYPWTPTGLKCCRAIEAKLKEKNT